VSAVAVTYTRSTGAAPNTNMKNVVFGALGRGIYISGQGRVWARCGRGAMQAVRLPGDGPPKAPCVLRQYIKSECIECV